MSSMMRRIDLTQDLKLDRADTSSNAPLAEIGTYSELDWSCTNVFERPSRHNQPAGSGKSTIVDLVKLYFQRDKPATFRSDNPEKFGKKHLLYKGITKPKKMLVCAEVECDFGRNVSQGEYRSIVQHDRPESRTREADTEI